MKFSEKFPLGFTLLPSLINFYHYPVHVRLGFQTNQCKYAHLCIVPSVSKWPWSLVHIWPARCGSSMNLFSVLLRQSGWIAPWRIPSTMNTLMTHWWPSMNFAHHTATSALWWLRLHVFLIACCHVVDSWLSHCLLPRLAIRSLSMWQWYPRPRNRLKRNEECKAALINIFVLQYIALMLDDSWCLSLFCTYMLYPLVN